jgi:hypothetical protein
MLIDFFKTRKVYLGIYLVQVLILYADSWLIANGYNSYSEVTKFTSNVVSFILLMMLIDFGFFVFKRIDRM